MTTTGRKASAEGSDFLIEVARSIGSTLGTVAAKVNSVTSAARPRPKRRINAPRKKSATVRAARSASRRTAARVSKTARKPRRHPRRNQKRNQKKSSM